MKIVFVIKDEKLIRINELANALRVFVLKLPQNEVIVATNDKYLNSFPTLKNNKNFAVSSEEIKNGDYYFYFGGKDEIANNNDYFKVRNIVFFGQDQLRTIIPLTKSTKEEALISFLKAKGENFIVLKSEINSFNSQALSALSQYQGELEISELMANSAPFIVGEKAVVDIFLETLSASKKELQKYIKEKLTSGFAYRISRLFSQANPIERLRIMLEYYESEKSEVLSNEVVTKIIIKEVIDTNKLLKLLVHFLKV